MKRRFAFISNWRSIELDAKRMLYSDALVQYLKPGMPRERIVEEGLFTIWTHFDVYHEVEGWIISIFLTAAQMINKPLFARQRVLQAVRYAQDELKAEFIGLGSYTSSITHGGDWLVRHADLTSCLTHGDSYAVAASVEGITEVLPLDLSSKTLAIVGAYGLIGEALAKLLCHRCSRLLLIGRRWHLLKALRDTLLAENGEQPLDLDISDNLEDIQEADVVITATSAPSAIIKPHYLKGGAWIYDVAQPMNTAPTLMEEREDVQVVDGAFVNIPGVDLGIDFGTPPGTAFACFTETLMQILEGNCQHHVGRIDLSHVATTANWAKKYGFTHAQPTCFGHKIDFKGARKPREKFLALELVG